MFTLTPTAAEQIIRAAEELPEGPAPHGIRIAAKIDDDGELVYGMGFDEEREDDLVLDGQGIAVLISPRSQALLESTRLDFVEVHPGEFQFLFSRDCDAPATKGCGSGGCGSCSSNRQPE